jgi:hypothetical protein
MLFYTSELLPMQSVYTHEHWIQFNVIRMYIYIMHSAHSRFIHFTHIQVHGCVNLGPLNL